MRTGPLAPAVSDALDALFEGLDRRLEVGHVAELLGMTKQGVYNWLRDGVIPGYKLGNSWFILRDDLKEAMRGGFNRPGGRPASPHAGEDGIEEE